LSFISFHFFSSTELFCYVGGVKKKKITEKKRNHFYFKEGVCMWKKEMWETGVGRAVVVVVRGD